MNPRNYQCRKCGKINQITTPWGMLFIPHLGWHKWLKCKCGAKRHFQRRVFQPELAVREALKMECQIVESHEESIELLLYSRNATQDKLEAARRELDEAYSMIDNLRDDIRELKNDKAELMSKLERLIYDTHLKDVFEEIEDAMMDNHTLDLDSYYPTPHYYDSLKDDIEAIKKKYGVGD